MDENTLKGLKIMHRKGACENGTYQKELSTPKSLSKWKVLNSHLNRANSSIKQTGGSKKGWSRTEMWWKRQSKKMIKRESLL